MCRKFGDEKKRFLILTMKRKGKNVERRMRVEGAQWQGDCTSLFIPFTVFQSKIISDA